MLSGEYSNTIALHSSGAPKRYQICHHEDQAGVAIPLPILIYANSGVSNVEQHDRVCKTDICGVPNSFGDEQAISSCPMINRFQTEDLPDRWYFISPTLERLTPVHHHTTALRSSLSTIRLSFRILYAYCSPFHLP